MDFRKRVLSGLRPSGKLYVELDERAEAARVLSMRAEAAVDVERRRLLFGQAAALASGEQAREIEVKVARLTLELIRSGARGSSREELRTLAARLEQVGEANLAAEVYAQVGDREAENAAWSYPEPSRGYEAIRDHVAFYPSFMDGCYVDEERVQPQEGDFYGGGITSDIEGPFKGGPGTKGW